MVMHASHEPLQVQKDKILNTYNTWFIHKDAVIVNDDLTVDVMGDVYAKQRPFPAHKIPVKFGRVTGSFLVDSTGITSFENSPRFIGSAAWYNNNLISTWAHAPDHVGSYLGIAGTELFDLTGLPQGVEYLACNYTKQMPLLRALETKEIAFPYVNMSAPRELVEIMNDPVWMGKGKSHMLNCALALKKAGFEGNARW